MKGEIVKVTHRNAGGSRISVGVLIDWTLSRISIEVDDPGSGDRVFVRHIPCHQILHVDEMPRVKLPHFHVPLSAARVIHEDSNKLDNVRYMYSVLLKCDNLEGPPLQHVRLTLEKIQMVIERFQRKGLDNDLVEATMRDTDVP